MFIIKFFLFIAFLISFQIFGYLLLTKVLKIHLKNILEKIVFSFGLTSILVSFVNFFIYLIKNSFIRNILTYSLFSALFIFSSIFFASNKAHFKQLKLKKTPIKKNRIYLILLIPIFVYLILQCFAPINEYDSLHTHAVIPNKLVQGNTLMEFKLLRHYYPLGWHMIYTFIKDIFKHDSFLRLFSLYSFVILLYALYLLSYKVFRKKNISLYSVVITLASPIFFRYSNSIYVDIPVVLFFMLGILLLFKLKEERNSSGITVLFFVFSFFMIAIKIQGFIYLFLSLLFCFFFILISKEIKLNYYNTILSIMLGILIVSPWYIRSYIKTGDLFAKADSPITKDEIINGGNNAHKKHLLSGFFSTYPGRKDKESNTVPDPRGRTGKFYGIFLLPWDFTVHGDWLGYWIGPIFLSLLIPYIIFYKRMKNKYINLFLIISFISFILWFYLLRHINIRYLFPTFALFNIISGYILFKIFTLENLAILSKFVKVYIFLIFSINTIGIPFIKEAKYIYRKIPTELTTSLNIYSEKEFLRAVLGDDHIKTIKKISNFDSKINILTNDECTYYFDRILLTGFIMDKYFKKGYSSREEFTEYCKEGNFKYYLYFNKNRHFKILLNKTWTPISSIATKIVFQDGNYTLFGVY